MEWLLCTSTTTQSLRDDTLLGIGDNRVGLLSSIVVNEMKKYHDEIFRVV